MAMKLSREQFLRNLGDSGLFSQEELSKSIDVLSETQTEDGEAIARHLIAAEKLTPFQVEAVCERRFEGLVIGNYQVLDLLGAGAMGTVYKARHRRMKRVVAIKVLSRSVAKSEKFIKRFQREVEAVARMNHPNIVMAHDADEAEVGHFLVMEFVNGRDLSSEVLDRGPLPISEAVECIVQAARALDYAHHQGIIHRDIKPANLLRDIHGVVKVADLGLARFDAAFGNAPEDAGALTQAGTIMGTVDYMSPEQAMGLTSIDHRADIYSLGCTLYFLLFGGPPYQGPTMMATLLKHRDAPIPLMAEAREDVPVELDAVFHRMVAKAPADRYQSMAEVVKALESIAANLGEKLATPSEGLVLDLDTSGPGASAGDWESGKTTVGPSPAAMDQTIDLAPPATPPVHALKVLLVEPSRTQSSIIRKYLQTQGVQHVVAVASGREALQAARSECPDAILSALHLSDMTGVQLAQRIREESKTAAPGFVLISSEAEAAEAGPLSKCGQAVLLHKPFTPEQLVEALRTVSVAPPPPSSTAERGKLRVLIVDDSAAARLHARRVLQELGLAQFVEAADGAQAVATMAREPFDLIVTDYNMPFLDGRGLVGYLKQNPATASIPIILVTTEPDPGKLEAMRQLGVTAICDKSLPSEVVRKIIDQLVGVP
ncbi:MAG TPA: response regulator [Gemmataceae bacterium]|jgi:serine/threonine protein kinase